MKTLACLNVGKVWASANGLGVTALRDIDTVGGQVLALRTSTGRLPCDSVVVAAGAWLGPMGRRFGLRLPVHAGKGYSFEVWPRQMPRHALLLLKRVSEPVHDPSVEVVAA